MRLDLKTVAKRMREAETEELLDNITVFRRDMEPAAVDLMEGELARRGLTDEEFTDHANRRAERLVLRKDGSPVRCSFCRRPAVVKARGWYRVFRYVPLFPKLFAYCEVHEAKS